MRTIASASAGKHKYASICLLPFALNSGMRLGEILALTWTGMDLFPRTVTVFELKTAKRLVQSGVDLYKVQRLLAHKSPMMTQRYAHHYPESLRDGVEILDRRSHRDTKMTTVLRVSESTVW